MGSAAAGGIDTEGTAPAAPGAGAVPGCVVGPVVVRPVVVGPGDAGLVVAELDGLDGLDVGTVPSPVGGEACGPQALTAVTRSTAAAGTISLWCMIRSPSWEERPGGVARLDGLR
jgi:hypothetical protein